MRRLVLICCIGLGTTGGCGGSRPEIRTYSSVPIAAPQQQLDGIGAGILNRLTGGLL